MTWLRIMLITWLLGSRAAWSADIDLSEWNPEHSPGTILEGSWDFYWGQLYTPDDFQKGRVSQKALAFSIPGVWNKVSIGELKLKPHYYATYRATVHWPSALVQKRSLITISLPHQPGAAKVWMDGQLVMKAGTVGRSEKKEVASVGGSHYTFMPDNPKTEIVIQVSSFHHRDGGTWWPIRVGLTDHVNRVNAAGVALDGFTLSCLFIMVFYHFGLWLMRPQYRAPLVFAIFCTIIALRASVTGLGDLHVLIYPNMPFSLQKVLEYAGFYLGVPAYYAFVRELYPDETRTWLYRVLCLFGGIFALSTVILPARIFTDFIEYYQVFTMAAILLASTQLFRAVRNQRDGIGWLLLGTLILVFSSVNDILQAHRSAPIPTMIFPYGLFFMILCQAILLARRFSQAFRDVEANEKQIQSLNAELQHQNAILDSLVEEKTRDIRSIMKNIKQGIFTVIGGGTQIGNEFSDHLRTLVASPQLKGGESLDSILDKSDLSRDHRDQVAAVLSNVVGEDSMAFEVNAHLLPRELRLQRSDRTRLLEMDWSPIENENSGQVEKVLVSLRDVTDLRQLQEESRRNQEELQLIGEILNVPIEKFDSLIHSCDKFLQDCQHELQLGNPDAHRLFRNMHTVKGMARSYRLTELAEAAHHAEEIYAQFRNGQRLDTQTLKQAGLNVDRLLKRYDDIHRHKLGRKGHLAESLPIDRAMIAEIEACLQSLDPKALHQDARSRVHHLTRVLSSLIHKPLPQLLSEILADIPRLAAELGKSEPEIIFRDPGLSIKPEAYELFLNTFTHLLRNALDHGLESAADRHRLGKTAWGRIVVELKLVENSLEIFVGDDGRGLNLNAIRRSAQQRGLIASDASLSDYEVANLIFAPGLSTKDQVTAVSGRGVGLDAVKIFLEQSHGHIEIQLGPPSSSSEGVPFRFHITLPASVCENPSDADGARVAAAS